MTSRKPAFQPRVSFISLGVGSFKKSLAFYRDALGFPLHDLQGNIAMFNCNGMVLALYPKKLLAEDANIKTIGKGFGGIALAHNVRRRLDVDRVLGTVKDRGARILKPAKDAFWGGRSGYFSDPDGYPWEVAWNPHIKLDSQGRLRLGVMNKKK